MRQLVSYNRGPTWELMLSLDLSLDLKTPSMRAFAPIEAYLLSKDLGFSQNELRNYMQPNYLRAIFREVCELCQKTNGFGLVFVTQKTI